MNYQGLPWLQFPDILGLQVESSLDNGAFTGQHHNLVVLIIESWTDSPRVAHGKHLARTCESAHHVAAVEMRHGGFQHIPYLHVRINISGYLLPFHSLFLGFTEEPFHFTVQAVAHQFQGDIGVAIETGRLSLAGQILKNLVDIGHIEVATETEIFSPPVVTAQEGMHILQSAASCRGITEVTHVELGIDN